MPSPSEPTQESVADEWRANWLSLGTWWWISPLLRLGAKRPLQFDDLGALDPKDASGQLAEQLHRQFQNGRLNTHFWNILFRSEGFIMVLAGIGKLLGDLLGFVGPLSLSGIVKFCILKQAGGTDEIWPAPGFPGAMEKGYWWMIAAFVSTLLQNFFLHQHHHYAIRAGMHVRTALTVLVYRKSLKITAGARSSFGQGFIQNAASVDANGVGMLFWYVHYAWAAPLQLAICMAMLYNELGPSAFVGLGVLLAIVPLQGWLSGMIGAASKKTMVHADTRVKLINEIVGGIRILKFMGWERSFSERVGGARAKELLEKRSVALLGATNTTILEVAPMLVALLTFLTYGYTSGTPLTASRAFTSLSLYAILRLPLMVVPMLIGANASARVSADRVKKYLSAPEQEEYRHIEYVASGGGAIELRAASLSWEAPTPPPTPKVDGKAAAAPASAGQEGTADTVISNPMHGASSTPVPFKLTDASLSFPAGRLSTIVGTVGSGKSSLLAAILGDMSLEGGEVILRLPKQEGQAQDSVTTSIAYCGQQPWIVNASVKENILFGSALDDTRYAQTIAACALGPDLAMLPAGDATEIGERGVNLSGGQKARIALARAVYSTCPVVLLDDPLSAVDAHVAAHLWQHALTGPHGFAGRTVILVSHQLQFVPRSDLVLVMHGGRVVQQGSYSDIMAQEGHNRLKEMMAERGKVDAELAQANVGNVTPASERSSSSGGVLSMSPAAQPDPAASPAPSASTSSTAAATPVVVTTPPVTASKADSGSGKTTGGGKTITDEDRATGSVPLAMYTIYVRSMGVIAVAIICMALVASNVSRIGMDWWLGVWSSDALGQGVPYYVGIYAAITGASACITLVLGAAWAVGGMKAALALHARMFASVLRSPVAFFDTTPAGRILNRFSTDISVIDKDLPTSFSSFAKLSAQIVGTIVVQATILPWTLLATVPLSLLFIAINTYFRASAREMKRLDNVSKSPVFSHLAETLSGLTSLRAYGKATAFAATCERLVDQNTKANWKQNVMNRWLGLRLDSLGAFLVGGICLVAVLTAGTVNPGLIGLSISYGMSITGLLNWMARNSSEVETYLASVERVHAYSTLPSEAAPHVPERAPGKAWPEAGAVEVKDLSMRYRPGLPLVLQNVSFSVAGGHKVGVCGRTGSGKSSLMLALFRIVEACEDEKTGQRGSITIDGVDIGQIGLEDLRTALAIIPQDPTLFQGTIRYNLDPTGAGSREGDEALWAALRQVRMEEAVQAMGGLDGAVQDGGSNLSVGQRQLLCMARALLRKSRVLVLDEATASVDVSTDAVVQAMLRTAFKDCTAFIIAHRINTILDCDVVLVLDGGRVAEYGPPQELMRTEGSLFGQLVRSSSEAHGK